MNPYESGAVIDMNMGHNSATPAPTGADALRVAAQAALTALENLHEIDTETECITIDVRDEIDALRAALASAAQRDLLRDFARAVMQAWPEGGIDGGELQDIALAHGLLRPAEPPTDWDGCNFYELTELIK